MSTDNQELRNAGLKVTLPRVKILQILEATSETSEHLSAEDVYQKLRDAGEDVGLATVYRVLTQFEAAGLVVQRSSDRASPEGNRCRTRFRDCGPLTGALRAGKAHLSPI